MFLDLLIRSSGVSGSPAQHLSALAPRYEGATIILYGPDLTSVGELPADCQVVGDRDQLSLAVQGAGNGHVIVYGADKLLGAARHQPVATIWVALSGGSQDVREVWRIRQLHSWVSSKRLGLLVEWLSTESEPDHKHLMRLTRASETLLVTLDGASLVDEVAAAFPADQAEQAEQIEQAEQAMEEAAASAEAAPTSDPAGEEADASAEFEPLAAIVAGQAAPLEADTTETNQAHIEGVNEPVQENNGTTLVAESPVTGAAEQALLRRYALVKERRTTTARVAEVKESLNNLLKEVFVSRFAEGVAAAESFEALTKKLADTSAEYAQLTKNLIAVEEELSKLAWLKDEIEL